MMCSNNGELLDEYIGVAFDGTTRLGEAINTTARWCPKDLKIKMRLIDFTTLKCAPAHPTLLVCSSSIFMYFYFYFYY